MSEENTQKNENQPEEATVEQLQKEVEKWKNFSRTWEERAKNAKNASDASANEAEKKVEEGKPLTAAEVQNLIRQEREKIQREVVVETARNELASAAKAAGLGEIAEFIDMQKFIGEDNNLDADRLAGFVTAITKASKKPSWGYAPERKEASNSKGLGQFLVD